MSDVRLTPVEYYELDQLLERAALDLADEEDANGRVIPPNHLDVIRARNHIAEIQRRLATAARGCGVY